MRIQYASDLHLEFYGNSVFMARLRWSDILQQLNGSVHLVAGNHDIYSAKEKGLKNFSSVKEQRIIEVGGQKIYLNHYPFLAYVGVDNNDFRPVSFAEVKMKIENQINF